MPGDKRRRRRTSDAQNGNGVQSVGIAAKVLKALAAQGGSLPLKELAAATAMPRAKVHRYLASLRSAGLIAQDPESGRYQIGAAAVTIGLVGLGRLSPVRQLQEAVPRLRERVNETVTAAIWGERGPTIVAIEESDHLVTMNVRIGTALPLLTTAIGRLFLAHLPASATQTMAAADDLGGAGSFGRRIGRGAVGDPRTRSVAGARSAAARRRCARRADLRLPRQARGRDLRGGARRRNERRLGRPRGQIPDRHGRRPVTAARARGRETNTRSGRRRASEDQPIGPARRAALRPVAVPLRYAIASDSP